MNNNELNFAIIGTGAIAAHHAKSIAELDNCRLVAVCSSSAERAVLAGKKFGVPAYHDFLKLLKTESVDVVAVCTESGNHMEPAIAAAKAGKHVLLEKPIEVSLERADKLISACRTAGVKLGVIFQNRYQPGFQQLKKAIDEGRLGKLLLGNAYVKWYRDENYYSSSNWKGTIKGDGGAALLNQGIHTIDLLLDIMGDVKNIYGQTKTLVHNIEGEDLGMAILNFKNAAMGSIIGSTALWPGYPERLEVFGERGSIILEAGQITAWNIRGEDPAAIPPATENASGFSDPMAVNYKMHKEQIEDMVNAILHDREPLVNGETARKSLELILAIYQSSKEKKLVEFS